MSGDARLRAALERARRRTGTPALAAAVVEAPGVVRSAAVGVRVRGGDGPASPDDLWHIGSCTKAVTATVFALLVQDGAARWGTPLPDLFPDLRGRMHPGWAGVTIDDVLRHRAGLPANLSEPALRSAAADVRPVVAQRAGATAEALAAPPRAPGTFRYSNLGYIVAGSAIEGITGTPWEQATLERLLGPLGASSAGFGAPMGRQPWGHATRWRGRGRGAPVNPGRPPHPAAAADNPPIMGPAGRLHLDLAGWGLFVAQFLTDGGTLLDTASSAHMLRAPEERGPRQAMGWAFPARRTRPRRDGIAFGHQGSNSFWAATAVVAGGGHRAALVVANDGRTRLLHAGAALAAELLRDE